MKNYEGSYTTKVPRMPSEIALVREPTANKGEPQLSRASNSFVSPDRLGKLAIAGLAIVVFFRIWEAILEFTYQKQMNLVSQGQRVGKDEINSNLSLLATSSKIALFFVGLTGIFFLLWFRRAYKNLEVFRIEGLRSTSAQAVGFFFIPFVNFIYPLRNAQEIWRASDPEIGSKEWQKTSKSRFVYCWWFSYIISGLITILVMSGVSSVNHNIVASRNNGELTADSARLFAGQLSFWIRFGIFGVLLTVVAALFAVQMIRKINERQNQKNFRLSTAGFFDNAYMAVPRTISSDTRAARPGFFAIVGGVLLMLFGFFAACPSLVSILDGQSFYSRETNTLIFTLAGLLPLGAGFVLAKRGWQRRRAYNR